MSRGALDMERESWMLVAGKARWSLPRGSAWRWVNLIALRRRLTRRQRQEVGCNQDGANDGANVADQVAGGIGDANRAVSAGRLLHRQSFG